MKRAVITNQQAVAGPGSCWPQTDSDWSQVVHCWAQRILLIPAETKSRAIKRIYPSEQSTSLCTFIQGFKGLKALQVNRNHNKITVRPHAHTVFMKTNWWKNWPFLDHHVTSTVYLFKFLSSSPCRDKHCSLEQQWLRCATGQCAVCDGFECNLTGLQCWFEPVIGKESPSQTPLFSSGNSDNRFPFSKCSTQVAVVKKMNAYYSSHWGYVFTFLLAAIHKNYWTDLHENITRGILTQQGSHHI